MQSSRAIAWVDRLIWPLIYVGLFTLVLGLASMKYHAAAAWSLVVVGGLLAVAGVVLIWVRSRLRPE